MKKIAAPFTFLCLLTAVLLLASFRHSGSSKSAYRFPYRAAGLSDRQAAAHLLDRFSFGVTPGQLETVTQMGLENWFEAQLAGSEYDAALDQKLARFESLTLSNAVIVQKYPKPGQVLRLAIADGKIDKASVNKDDKEEYKRALQAYMKEKDLKPGAELLRELAGQKILSAAYSKNQLHQVMTEFWFNHFNVAASKGGVQQFITSYERDAIRPNLLGNFETLLLATAKSPAMLTYLDNNKSTVDPDDAMAAQGTMAKAAQKRRAQMVDSGMQQGAKLRKPRQGGLNENYAREIMELHTLGVDGGYGQADVTNAARVLTGWGVNPAIEYNLKVQKAPNEQRAKRLGFVYDDNFLFSAHKHDRGEKKVLGVVFPAGNGYDEGARLLHLLATHPATAAFISKKLATRFVSDVPPQALVDAMARTFLQTEGNIREVLITMVSSPLFWKEDALRSKTKSPFELAISAVRSTGAEVTAPFALYQWIARMGQKVYHYAAPTGFPDRGAFWINSGSLLNRMNFGLALASGRIPGVKMDLLQLNNGREPESTEAALKIYSTLLMPERDVTQTIERLTPLLNDPSLVQKIEEQASRTPAAKSVMQEEGSLAGEAENGEMEAGKKIKGAGKRGESAMPTLASGNNSVLAQVVGIIIGSPEFQRR